MGHLAVPCSKGDCKVLVLLSISLSLSFSLSLSLSLFTPAFQLKHTWDAVHKLNDDIQRIRQRTACLEHPGALKPVRKGR